MLSYLQNLKPLRRATRLFVTVSFFAAFFGEGQAKEGMVVKHLAEKTVVAISQIVEHPSLDAVRKGLLDYLAERGFVAGKNLTVLYKNAQGSVTTSSQIAQSLASHEPSPTVFVAIGTPTAQGAIAATRGKNIPVVFTAVTDPVSSRLVKNLEKHSKRLTGIIDYPPLDEQFSLMKRLMPELKSIGVMYNPGESNSVSVVKAFKEKAKKAGLQVIEGPVNKAVDLPIAFRQLQAKGVEVIYVPQDNTVISAMPQLSGLSYTHKIPVFTSDNGSVKEGALACMSYSYYTVGKSTGNYIVRLIQGESAGDLPIKTPDDYQLYVNTKAAEKLGLELPKAFLKAAVLYPKKEPSS